MSLSYYKVIRGHLVVKGYQPDGDSIRFRPDNAQAFADIHRGFRVRPSKKDGSVQLRLDGMDAPETHYGTAAQRYGNESRDALLKWLGFEVAFGQDGKTVSDSKPLEVGAVILTKGADVHGRPIAYCFRRKDIPEEDGNVCELSELYLQLSVNSWMVSQGYAYALSYSSTPLGIRQALRQAAKEARSADKGFWPLDETELFALDDQDSIGPEGALIFPKLFRRCTDFLKAVGKAGPGYDLGDWLRENPNQDDELFIEAESPGNMMTLRLSSLLEQRNSKVAVNADMLDVVFIEK